MTPRKVNLVRFLLVVVGGLIGAALAAGYTYVNWEKYQKAPHDSFQRLTITFQSCIILIMGIYNVEYFGSRLFGLHGDAEAVRSQKRRHGYLLNGLLLFLFLMSYFFA